MSLAFAVPSWVPSKHALSDMFPQALLYRWPMGLSVEFPQSIHNVVKLHSPRRTLAKVRCSLDGACV
jgi:hypothetical protein